MKPSIFCNKKSSDIVSTKAIEDIKSLIKTIGSFNTDLKYYSFLNRKNISDLKDGRYNVALSTFGKKFVMFITNYANRKYCIFINKKNEAMTVVQMKFTNEMFNGSLFDGELVKTEYDEWIFLINDVMYYKGENIVTKHFDERQNIINEFLENEYEYDEKQGFQLSKKRYFPFEQIKDLVETYMNVLSYKSAGLHFKNLDNFCSNYLYIFPENRTDSKILQSGTIIDDITNNVTKEIKFNPNVNVVMNVISSSSSSPPTVKEENTDLLDEFEEVEAEVKAEVKPIENKTCKFLIMTTSMPDIYGLYCKGHTGSSDRYSYASVPDMETSNFLNNLFKNNERNGKIYVECNYHKGFKKWVPFRVTDSMDTLNTINKTQILLDAM